jgi:hypothetical protein
MDLSAIERIVIAALSLVATAACILVIARVLKRRDLPTPLLRIEIAWTAVSLVILLATLAAATSVLPLDG